MPSTEPHDDYYGAGGQPGHQRCEESSDPQECRDEKLWGAVPKQVFEKGRYVVYEDAECGAKFAKYTSCTEYAPGTSVRYTTPGFRSCEKGTHYCVAVKSIVGKYEYFASKDCTGTSHKTEDANFLQCEEDESGEPPGPDVEKQDSTDRFRIYRNATCGLSRPALTGTCIPSGGSEHGPYVQFRRQDTYACRHGQGYCAETDLEVATQTYYDLKNEGKCSVPLFIEHIQESVCKM
jgi:hypothetical protein